MLSALSPAPCFCITRVAVVEVGLREAEGRRAQLWAEGLLAPGLDLRPVRMGQRLSVPPGSSEAFVERAHGTFSLPQDLNCLMERYLRPLQNETFLTQDEVPWEPPSHGGSQGSRPAGRPVGRAWPP